MKHYILTARETKRTELTKFAAMKTDWHELTITQRYAVFTNMLAGIALSQDRKDQLVFFCKTDNSPKFETGSFELIRIDKGNLFEFVLVEVNEIYPTFREVDDEEYAHYCEDAQDELEK